MCVLSVCNQMFKFLKTKFWLRQDIEEGVSKNIGKRYPEKVFLKIFLLMDFLKVFRCKLSEFPMFYQKLVSMNQCNIRKFHALSTKAPPV